MIGVPEQGPVYGVAGCEVRLQTLVLALANGLLSTGVRWGRGKGVPVSFVARESSLLKHCAEIYHALRYWRLRHPSSSKHCFHRGYDPDILYYPNSANGSRFGMALSIIQSVQHRRGGGAGVMHKITDKATPAPPSRKIHRNSGFQRSSVQKAGRACRSRAPPSGSKSDSEPM